jgi:hypothetical protein
MFKSGFLIFLITEKKLITSKDSESLPILYKNLVINNKLNLINNTYKILNMNSLKFIMIKLGIMYKEFYLIENAMADLKGFDLKTAHLLMQYIVETSDLNYVVENLNDNFFIYSIRTALNYMIKLFSKRVESLKNDDDFKKSKFLKNTKFLNYFEDYKSFKELIILSKYLDVLRKLDNEIYYKRKICAESLNIKINKLSVKVQDKNNDLRDISYYKNQLYRGKVSDAQNYVITQISRRIKSENLNLMVLNKVMVELYCFKILQEEEKLYGLCITILRNVAQNPNLFFKNIAMKTQIRPLRNFLINHLQHSKFTSQNDTEYFKLMKYIDKHYSNPSFNVEYNLKLTKILLSREFTNFKCDMMINKNYKLVRDSSKSFNEYQSIASNKDPSGLKNPLKVEYITGGRKKSESHSHKKSSTLFSKSNLPLLNSLNLKKLEEVLNYNFILNEWLFMDIYDNFFFNSEIDDFGMNKRDYQMPPHFLYSEHINILSHLISKYFSEHDEKIYQIAMNLNEKDKKKSSLECIICKKSSGTLENVYQTYVDRNTYHLGYSNISYENLKYFDISNKIRIKFDDFLKQETSTEKILNNLVFKNIPQIKSIFYYITGLFQTNLLNVFINKLTSFTIFKKSFLSDQKISTEYFCQETKNFSFIRDSMRAMFNFNDNSYIKEIIFTNFVSKGILIDSQDYVEKKTIRNLILNDLIEIQDKTYYTYNKYHNQENQDDSVFIENFILKNKYDYEIKNRLERLSKFDEKMDEFILNTEKNHYLLENFLDFNLLNPKSIFYKYQDKLNTWQRIILLSKYDININIFEIALENLQIINFKNDQTSGNKFEQALIFYGCLIYHKVSNLYLRKNLESKNLTTMSEIYNLCKPYMPKLLSEIEEKDDRSNFNEDDHCKDSHSGVNYPENFSKEELLTNNIFTCNKDISIKCLINNYWKFLNSNNLTEWKNRSENNSIVLDNFEILIENGRVIDAYYFYIEFMKLKYSTKEIETMLYHICLNNLLNYNIFSSVVTFLYLINGSTKDLIVQIEAANRIITHELNILARNDKTIPVEEMIKFLKSKNLNLKPDKKYFEINEEFISNNFKQIISIYKKLVSEFSEFKEINKTSNENIVFQILKRLEDATWDGNKQFLLNTPAKEIALDSPWHLVSLFCRIHNYEMSLTLLHELGRNNNWIAFLYKAQDQDCPPANVLMIIDGYFKDATLKTHLFITIQSMLDTNVVNENNLEKKSVSEFTGENYQNTSVMNNLSLNQNLMSSSNLNVLTNNTVISSTKLDFGKNSFNDFNLYLMKQKAKSSSTASGIYDPIYFMTLPDNPKERGLKNMNILNESININWKDLILVSLIFSNSDYEMIFTNFTLYLYMSVKEILITKNSHEDFLSMKNFKVIRNLREIFDNKKKSLKLIDLENLIKVLLLNNYPQVLLEVLDLFDMPYSFDEFVLFCKTLFENNYEDAFIHLFIFKNSMFEYFQSNFSNNFTGKVWEEEGNVNNINIEFISTEIKNFKQLILTFFFQVANTIINNLIELYDNKLDSFKLYKLLEILYLTKWNKRYSNYFKNMCVLEHIKSKKVRNLNYKFPFEKIVELLIAENNFNILSEYILSYEENKEDDTLLYNIFSTITSFDKNYIIYSDEERTQFWECLENLLIKANFSNLKIAKFFLFILETKESKFYLREQMMLIVKTYQYLNIQETSFSSLRSMDKFSKFMKTVIGYKIHKEVKESELIEDLKNKIFIIVFSNCDIENLKKIIFSNLNIRKEFGINHILEFYATIIKNIRESSPAINFSKSCKTFWKKISNEDENLDHQIESNHQLVNKIPPTLNKDKNSFSLNNKLPEKNSFTNFNESVRKACLNLINLNQLNLSLHLSNFYNLSIEELEKFDMFMRFVIGNFEELKTIAYSELNSIYNKACNKNLEPSTSYVKSVSYEVNHKLIYHLNNCLKYKSIEHIVLYEILKILISIEINLDLNMFNNFDENIEIILYKLIETQDENYKDIIINDLNKIIDNDELLARTLVGKFFEQKNKFNKKQPTLIKSNLKLFRYVKYFKTPYKLGFGIKNHFKNTPISLSNEIKSLDSDYWELIFLGYYCFLKDCFHSELNNFNHIIQCNIDEQNFFRSVYKLFGICEDEVRVKEIFYCINKIIIKSSYLGAIFNNHSTAESSENFNSKNNTDTKILNNDHRKINTIDIYGKFKSEIEFYNKSKNFKKLGEIYLKLANDYSLLTEDKNGLFNVNQRKNFDIIKKQQELTILNLYIRAAELFLMDNCILNYSKVFNDINKLIKEKFSDDVDINFQ